MMQMKPSPPLNESDAYKIKFAALKAFARLYKNFFFFAPEIEEVIRQYIQMRQQGGLIADETQATRSLAGLGGALV